MSMETEKRLSPYLRPSGAWAFALGTSIGWGSLVITCSTYLSQAGPVGSAVGLIVGALIMLVIGWNYHYLMNCFPEAGGGYAYAREAFGYDHGFLIAWFLLLTYFAMLWANATALPLFARYFLGDMFRHGYLYNIFGYDVYLGEAALSAVSVMLAAAVCCVDRRKTAAFMTGLVILFTAGISICFLLAMLRRDVPIAPLTIPDRHIFSQILHIAVISPWAFVGFENISHSTEEFSFKRSWSARIMAAAVVTSTVLYIFIMLLSVSAYPAGYGSWLAYIRDLDNLEGLQGLPAFFAAEHYLGRFGVVILMLSLLALVITSLLGNLVALSRLLFALTRDRILPEHLGVLNRHGVPWKTVFLTASVSLLVPFVGRTAIGWIVDVTTIGATLIYGFVSAAAYKMAGIREDRLERRTGAAGLAIMIGFGIYLLVPNLFMLGSMATVSYILFVVWSVIGFLFFRMTLRNDSEKRFGQSIIVWIALLSLILFVSLVWMSQSFIEVTNLAMNNLQEYYSGLGMTGDQTAVMDAQMRMIRYTNARSIVVVVGLFMLSLAVLLNNYALMSRRAQESEHQLGKVRDIANTDPLTGVKSKHAFTEKEKELDAQIAAGMFGGGGTAGGTPVAGGVSANGARAELSAAGKDNVGGPGTGSADGFALVICDVNGLKSINDTYGHKAGDEYIRAACALICELYSHSPVYRIGGDEFAVLLTGRDFEERERLLRELHERSAAHIGHEHSTAVGESRQEAAAAGRKSAAEHPGRSESGFGGAAVSEDSVVVSGGMSVFRPGSDKSLRAVFERADARMYEEKKRLKALGAVTRT